MNVYIFYSEFNDRYNKSIPQEVRDAVEHEGKQVPKKYRSEYDVFISGINEFSPTIYNYDSAHIWLGRKNKWFLSFYRSGNVDEICPKKYLKTLKKINSFPDYIPTWPLHIIIMLGWMADNDDYDGIEEIMNEYDIKIHNGKGI